jgi:hypothetical protein
MFVKLFFSRYDLPAFYITGSEEEAEVWISRILEMVSQCLFSTFVWLWHFFHREPYFIGRRRNRTVIVILHKRSDPSELEWSFLPHVFATPRSPVCLIPSPDHEFAIFAATLHLTIIVFSRMALRFLDPNPAE